MSEDLISLLPELWTALGETGVMLAIALSAAVVLGGPLGIVLFLTGRGQLWERPRLHFVLNAAVNLVRSFPFVILLVVLVPLTRIVAGTTIGPLAAAVPLSAAAIPYFARLVEQSVRDVSPGVIEAAQAMGATPLQLIVKVLITEAAPTLASSLTVLAVSFISYSAAAGIVGGGGIGDLAIRFGYYRFQTDVMLITVAILIVIVQSVQAAGNLLSRRLDHR
ncbi:MAG: ABC transporter permease [Burkholderiales bacterium]|nr:ABC transporter permease [Burkholderiales bacterium]